MNNSDHFPSAKMDFKQIGSGGLQYDLGHDRDVEQVMGKYQPVFKEYTILAE